ncbi:MAG: transglycosylase SLT domain-containing protein [Alphaproteobacteria bacterium]|nr:transglycosylase SLT domain-containing protein [Alphaproteobacteria bacterium]
MGALLFAVLGDGASPAAAATSDTTRLRQAYQAIDKADFSAARSFAAQMNDSVARRLVEWRMATIEGSGASFDQIDRFWRENTAWPQRVTLRRRAEAVLPTSWSPDEVIAWFAGNAPESAMGKLRLGEAHLSKGNSDYGSRLVQEAWIEGDFTPAQETAILASHRPLLTPAINRLRADRLLFDEQRSAAQRMLTVLDGQTVTLVKTRIEVARNLPTVERTLSGLPATLRGDAGLLFEEARWNRLKGRDREAWPLLLSAPSSLPNPSGAEAFWQERHIQARNAIEVGLYDKAYLMVANHGMKAGSGVAYAEAEFLAGWLALRFLNNTAAAAKHFAALREGVNYPISLARANYWLGRTAEKAGRPAEATAHYQAAAGFGETFYGQLALAALSPQAQLSLPSGQVDTKAARTAFEAHDMTRAVRFLAAINDERYLRIFALHFADIATDAPTYALLATLLREEGYANLALRVAKRALQKQVPLMVHAYPVVDVPRYNGRGSAPEAALVLGLSRQESEFDPNAVSPAGARGLMQLMPKTAQATARAHGLRYAKDRLLGDTDYNMSIGMAHLSDLLRSYNGSYILSIAAYNAGGGRVRQWISTYGDPRSAGIDPIDWIEKIPISETRNYVQRVLENTQVYRQRLAGRPVPLGTVTDLWRASAAPPAPSVIRTGLPRPTHRPLIEGIAGSHADGPLVVPRPSPRRIEAQGIDEAAATETQTAPAPIPAPMPAPAATPRPNPRGAALDAPRRVASEEP